MSRLRARTWTPFERRVMRRWFWQADPDVFYMQDDTGHRYQLRGNEGQAVEDLWPSAAERIMRTKGIDVRAAWMNAKDPSHYPPQLDPERAEELRGIRDGQRLSRRPDAAMRASVGEARLERRFRCCYVPSDSNPNIFVRRSA